MSALHGYSTMTPQTHSNPIFYPYCYQQELPIFFPTLIDNTSAMHPSTQTLYQIILHQQSLITFLNCNIWIFFFANSQESKSNLFKRNLKNFDQNKFISDSKNVNWDEIIDVNKENVNLYPNNNLYIYDLLLERHAPLKRLNKQEPKFQLKPWITRIKDKRYP